MAEVAIERGEVVPRAFGRPENQRAAFIVGERRPQRALPQPQQPVDQSRLVDDNQMVAPPAAGVRRVTGPGFDQAARQQFDAAILLADFAGCGTEPVHEIVPGFEEEFIGRLEPTHPLSRERGAHRGIHAQRVLPPPATEHANAKAGRRRVHPFLARMQPAAADEDVRH